MLMRDVGVLQCKRVTTFAVSCSFIYGHFRDWSLITGRGGYKTGGGGAREVLPLQKGGGGKSFSHTEGGGGHKKCWGSFYAVA